MRILTSRDVFFFSDDRRRAEYDLRLRDSTSSYTRTSSGWASSSATYGYGYGYGHGGGSWRRTPPGSRAGASGIATESFSVLLPGVELMTMESSQPRTKQKCMWMSPTPRRQAHGRCRGGRRYARSPRPVGTSAVNRPPVSPAARRVPPRPRRAPACLRVGCCRLPACLVATRLLACMVLYACSVCLPGGRLLG
jgi:hypothetical protein